VYSLYCFVYLHCGQRPVLWKRQFLWSSLTSSALPLQYLFTSAAQETARNSDAFHSPVIRVQWLTNSHHLHCSSKYLSVNNCSQGAGNPQTLEQRIKYVFLPVPWSDDCNCSRPYVPIDHSSNEVFDGPCSISRAGRLEDSWEAASDWRLLLVIIFLLVLQSKAGHSDESWALMSLHAMPEACCTTYTLPKRRQLCQCTYARMNSQARSKQANWMLVGSVNDITLFNADLTPIVWQSHWTWLLPSVK